MATSCRTACCRPGGMYRPRGGKLKTNLQFPVPFGSSLTTTLACLVLRSLAQIHIRSPYPLSRHHPVCGYQEGRFLTISAPHVRHASVHCQVRSLFRTLDSFGGTKGSLLSFCYSWEQLPKTAACRSSKFKRLSDAGRLEFSGGDVKWP